MAEGGMEMGEMDEAEAPDDVETSFMNISAEDSENIHHLEETLSQYTGDSQFSQRERLKGVRLKPSSTISNLNSKEDWLLLQPSTLNLS